MNICPVLNIKETGRQIRSLRKNRHITPKQLAERCFCSEKTIYNWENGASMPDASSLVILAHALHVSVDDILYVDRTWT